MASLNKNHLTARCEKYLTGDELPLIDLINTDDKPVLEKYNANANKTWRTNYLRYYQNH
jgi:hypothetical protein